MNLDRPVGVSWSDLDTLSPDLRALLECAGAVLNKERLPGLQSALEACSDTDRLVRLALHHGMLGHLGRAVDEASAAVDGVLQARLAELCRALALRNLDQTRVLLQVLSVLSQSEIHVIALRGPVWAQALYGDISLRTWSDLDLLVSQDQAAIARQVLLDYGFVDSHIFNDRIVRGGWGDIGQIPLSTPDARVFVDLHWKLAVSVGPRPMTADSILKRGGRIDLLGHPVVCPGKADLVAMSCLEGARDRWNTVGRLLDLAILVESVPASDWTGLLEIAKEAGYRRRVVASVAHVCDVFGLTIPSPVFEVVDRDAVSRALVRSLGPGSLANTGAKDPRQRMTHMLWQWASEDRCVDSLRHFAARLFGPTVEDWSSLPLPRRLEWLYPVLRPGRLMVKWSRMFFSASHPKENGV